VFRHLLGVLQSSIVLQVDGDACCPPGVTSNGGEKAGRLGPLSDRFANHFAELFDRSSDFFRCRSLSIDSFNTLPNRDLETLKTLRAQRQVRWPV
jgi:hypothetical protein